MREAAQRELGEQVRCAAMRPGPVRGAGKGTHAWNSPERRHLSGHDVWSGLGCSSLE